MKAVVFTLGCKVNECESDAIISGLIERGYTVSDKLEKADLYVVNTCAVTTEAEKKSRQMASRIKALNPKAKVIFTGCATQNNAEAFKNKFQDCVITGVFNKGKVLDLLDFSGINLYEESKIYEDLPIVTSLKTRAFIKVQDGCNNFCSYCIIPYLRGRSRSRNPKYVIEEIEKCSASEVIITGIDLSSYNYENINLAGLMLKLKDIKKRIRLGSLELRIISEEFLTALKSLNKFAPHFHLSLQSGSNSVLKKMNRHYTREDFFEKVNLIRKYFPDAGITTDIIVGFPTETEQDFLDTVDLVEKVEFSDIHPFIFSPRKGTVAYKMQDYNGTIKKERLDRLLILKEKCKQNFINKMQGEILEFIGEEEIDGYTTGYSENYLRLYVKNCKIKNSIVKVKVKSAYLDGAIAEAIE